MDKKIIKTLLERLGVKIKKDYGNKKESEKIGEDIEAELKAGIDIDKIEIPMSRNMEKKNIKKQLESLGVVLIDINTLDAPTQAIIQNRIKKGEIKVVKLNGKKIINLLEQLNANI